jgi:hypothetical protein
VVNGPWIGVVHLPTASAWGKESIQACLYTPLILQSMEEEENRGLYRPISEHNALKNRHRYNTESMYVCIAHSGVPAALSQWGRLSASWSVLVSFRVPAATLLT